MIKISPCSSCMRNNKRLHVLPTPDKKLRHTHILGYDPE